MLFNHRKSCVQDLVSKSCVCFVIDFIYFVFMNYLYSMKDDTNVPNGSLRNFEEIENKTSSSSQEGSLCATYVIERLHL